MRPLRAWFLLTAFPGGRRDGAQETRPTPGIQLALFVEFTYHAYITNRDGAMLELEVDHRRHAEIENTIRDLKYGVGLNHLPSGRFGAMPPGWPSTSWLTTWPASAPGSVSATPSSPPRPFAAATCLFLGASPGRPDDPPFTLPTHWPWAKRFEDALRRHRAIVLVT
jgi:hypothetical protein